MVKTKKAIVEKGAEKFRLISVFGKVDQIYVIQPCINPETGQYPAHIRPVNSNGDMILSEDDIKMQSSGKMIFIPSNKMIEFESGKEFDMSKPMDRALWEAIEHCPLIASSRDDLDDEGNSLIDGSDKRYGVAELYVENPVMEAQRSVSVEKTKFDAKKLIFEDPRGDAGRRIMCKIIGRDMDTASDSDVTEYLLKLADRAPQRIITLYTGDDLNLRILFVEARAKKVITIKNKTYVYGSEGQFMLGATDDAAISWMKNPDNKRIVAMIKQDVNPITHEQFKDNSSENSSNDGFSDDGADSIEAILNKKGSKK